MPDGRIPRTRLVVSHLVVILPKIPRSGWMSVCLDFFDVFGVDVGFDSGNRHSMRRQNFDSFLLDFGRNNEAAVPQFYPATSREVASAALAVQSVQRTHLILIVQSTHAIDDQGVRFQVEGLDRYVKRCLCKEYFSVFFHFLEKDGVGGSQLFQSLRYGMNV